MSDILKDTFETVYKEEYDALAKEGKTVGEIKVLLEERSNKALESVIEKASEYCVQNMNEHMFENELAWESQDAEFIARQEQKWGKCFSASRMMYSSALEVAEAFKQYITLENPPADFNTKKYTFHCLVHLHGRACQIFLEILTLLKGGFADGALARCRSLYELCCVASFIKDQGESIAEAYYKQPYTDYNKKSYKWANGAKDNDGHIVKFFSQIQDLCRLSKEWKDEYDLSCLVTHASPQGTFGRISKGIGLNLIPVGRSDYNIKIPAMHSVQCLFWISLTFVSLFSHIDSLAYVKALEKWADIVCDMNTTTQDKVFEEAIKAGQAK